ncbi:MAG: DUF3179 domain-containing protein [Dehalococcoidia bacterium]|nr:DUF3179 domain-containing protein [Dehalococcoidia bacterium]
MSRFIGLTGGLLLAVTAVLAGACGEQATPISTPMPERPDGAPFSVSSPTPGAEAPSSLTPRPTFTTVATLNDERLRESLTAALYERPDVTTGASVTDFQAPGVDLIRLTRDPHNAPFLVDMLNVFPYGQIYRTHLLDTLRDLTGEEIFATDGFPWLQWVGEHPEYGAPREVYSWWKGEVLSTLDERFREFLPGDDIAHTIRLEEIVWGGVVVDGIPSLDNPDIIPAHEARYLEADEQVFGVYLNGEARAYPLRIMNWHEMTNDVVGGQPFALAYCTLCGSGILYDTRRGDGQEPYVFGSSGLLYRSNKLMYDADTNSLWNQFTGIPVVGELVGEDIELPILPVTLTTWGEWNSQHPETTVLSLDTGHERPYEKPGTPGAAYYGYFSSPSLMFPGGPGASDLSLRPKDQVFVAILDSGEAKAYPLETLEELGATVVLNDAVSEVPIVVITDEGGGVQAFLRENRSFELASGGGLIDEQGGEWRVTPEGLSGPNGEIAARVSGHVAFWFGYASFRPGGELYTGN